MNIPSNIPEGIWREIWRELVESVKRGKCILFLGSMASAPSTEDSSFPYTEAPPSGSELTRRLVERCGYPDEDVTNLQRVAFYYEVHLGRHSLVQAIEEKIYISENEQAVELSPAFCMLAELPFPIVITTNYDRLFDQALKSAKTINGKEKKPVLRIYNPVLGAAPEKVLPYPPEDKPILLKLHGDFSNEDSLVVTDEDYIGFIQKMNDQHSHPIHKNIRARMVQWPVLFIGYSLKDFNLRLLFRVLWHEDSARIPNLYVVDPSPDELIAEAWRRRRPGAKVHFIRENLWDVVPELYKAIKGHPYKGPCG